MKMIFPESLAGSGGDAEICSMRKRGADARTGGNCSEV